MLTIANVLLALAVLSLVRGLVLQWPLRRADAPTTAELAREPTPELRRGRRYSLLGAVLLFASVTLRLAAGS
ncbi:MAG: hypothetical protein V2J24_16090 [Pseudomonadales bacterium]|jgi:hypothetical protein|nr:hypothetical protein [Pseudomonadales bacterium]